jgi:hypothetical protein
MIRANDILSQINETSLVLNKSISSIPTQLEDKEVIREAWHSSWKSSIGRYAEIFHNPSQIEIRRLGKTIRFYAVANRKDLYVWKATTVLHGEVMTKLNLPNPFISADTLPGEAELRNSCFEMEHSALIETLYSQGNKGDFDSLRNLKNILSYDWKWIEHYGIDVEPYLKPFRDDL